MRNTILIALITLLFLSGCSTSDSSSMALEDVVVQKVISEYNLDDQPVDDYYAIFVYMSGPDTVSKVWRYQSGELEIVDSQFYYDAMGDDRSKWPPDTFVFVFLEQSDGYAEVSVTNHYNMGDSPDSRGGNNRKVILKSRGLWWKAEWAEGSFWD